MLCPQKKKKKKNPRDCCVNCEHKFFVSLLLLNYFFSTSSSICKVGFNTHKKTGYWINTLRSKYDTLSYVHTFCYLMSLCLYFFFWRGEKSVFILNSQNSIKSLGPNSQLRARFTLNWKNRRSSLIIFFFFFLLSLFLFCFLNLKNQLNSKLENWRMTYKRRPCLMSIILILWAYLSFSI